MITNFLYKSHQEIGYNWFTIVSVSNFPFSLCSNSKYLQQNPTSILSDQYKNIVHHSFLIYFSLLRPHFTGISIDCLSTFDSFDNFHDFVMKWKTRLSRTKADWWTTCGLSPSWPSRRWSASPSSQSASTSASSDQVNNKQDFPVFLVLPHLATFIYLFIFRHIYWFDYLYLFFFSVEASFAYIPSSIWRRDSNPQPLGCKFSS